MPKKNEVHDIQELLSLVSRSFHTIDQPKLRLSKAIYEATKEQELSLRKLAAKIKELYADDPSQSTPHYNGIQRITAGENYTVDNLLMVLDALDLELVVQKRTKEIPPPPPKS